VPARYQDKPNKKPNRRGGVAEARRLHAVA